MRSKSFAKSLEGTVKEILGTAQSVGARINGKPAHLTIDAINNGEVDSKYLFYFYSFFVKLTTFQQFLKSKRSNVLFIYSLLVLIMNPRSHVVSSFQFFLSFFFFFSLFFFLFFCLLTVESLPTLWCMTDTVSCSYFGASKINCCKLLTAMLDDIHKHGGPFFTLLTFLIQKLSTFS